MKKYEVTTIKATFPAGIMIELSPEQAKARVAVLQKKKGDVYQTLEPISFKTGERIGLEDGSISRLTLACLKPLEAKSASEIKVAHIGSGKYCVVGPNGDRLCELGTKEQAEAALKGLSEKQDGV